MFLYHHRTFSYIVPLSPQNSQLYRSFITTEHSAILFLYHHRTFSYIVPLSPQNIQLYRSFITTEHSAILFLYHHRIFLYNLLNFPIFFLRFSAGWCNLFQITEFKHSVLILSQVSPLIFSVEIKKMWMKIQNILLQLYWYSTYISYIRIVFFFIIIIQSQKIQLYHSFITTEHSTISFLYHLRTFRYIVPLSPQNIQLYHSFITSEHSDISFLYHHRTVSYIIKELLQEETTNNQLSLYSLIK